MPNQNSKKVNFVVSVSPHIEADDHIVRRMWAVVFSLLPAGLTGIFIFGIYTLYVILVSCIAALITELAIQKISKRKVSISDGSALITGLLLAYILPPRAPLWLAAIGAFFAIAVGKQVFGGLGFNIFNPALVARAFLMLSWPRYMTSWINPRWVPDAVSTATPLGIVKEHGLYKAQEIGFSYWDLFIGNRAGCIGEVCILVLALGALYLLIKQYISWRISITYIFTTGLLSWMFASPRFLGGDFLFSILSGGLILGAFFMATDYVTCPLSPKGRFIFGLGCGILTFVIRKWAGYPEGVCYAILMMNAATPIIDRFSMPKKYGYKKI